MSLARKASCRVKTLFFTPKSENSIIGRASTIIVTSGLGTYDVSRLEVYDGVRFGLNSLKVSRCGAFRCQILQFICRGPCLGCTCREACWQRKLQYYIMEAYNPPRVPFSLGERELIEGYVKGVEVVSETVPQNDVRVLPSPPSSTYILSNRNCSPQMYGHSANGHFKPRQTPVCGSSSRT